MLLIDSPEKVSGNDLGYSVFQLSVESQQSMMNLYFSQKKDVEIHWLALSMQVHLTILHDIK